MERPDPFYVVRDEVIKSLDQAKVEYEAWKHEVVSKSTNIKPVETALRETIRNIDWDLEDLQVCKIFFGAITLAIIFRNPCCFLKKRKGICFIFIPQWYSYSNASLVTFLIGEFPFSNKLRKNLRILVCR